MPHASGSSGARVTARSRRSARRPERGLPGRAILTPAMPAPQRRRKSAGCAESLLPATPQAAVGPLSSKSTVPTLRRRLRSFLTPAKTVRVCLRCQTSRASARLSSAPQPGPSAESTALTLRPGRFDCRCHFSSLQLKLAISYSKTSSLQPYNLVFQIDYSSLPALAQRRTSKGRQQLNRPTGTTVTRT